MADETNTPARLSSLAKDASTLSSAVMTRKRSKSQPAHLAKPLVLSLWSLLRATLRPRFGRILWWR